MRFSPLVGATRVSLTERCYCNSQLYGIIQEYECSLLHENVWVHTNISKRILIRSSHRKPYCSNWNENCNHVVYFMSPVYVWTFTFLELNLINATTHSSNVRHDFILSVIVDVVNAIWIRFQRIPFDWIEEKKYSQNLNKFRSHWSIFFFHSFYPS